MISSIIDFTFRTDSNLKLGLVVLDFKLNFHTQIIVQLIFIDMYPNINNFTLNSL